MGQAYCGAIWDAGCLAGKCLRDKDKRSTAYYQLYIGKGWGVVQNYPIALNSGALGIDSCVRIIAELY